MIEKTLELCAELCGKMLRDYAHDIDDTITRLPEDETALVVNMGFRIKPKGMMKNEVTASIAFVTDRVKDKCTKEVDERQIDIQFSKARILPPGEKESPATVEIKMLAAGEGGSE